MVAVDDERALTMVEIRVPDRKGKSLHSDGVLELVLLLPLQLQGHGQALR